MLCTDDLLMKVRDGETLTRADLVYLLSLPFDSSDAFRVLAEACQISKTMDSSVCTMRYASGRASIQG